MDGKMRAAALILFIPAILTGQVRHEIQADFFAMTGEITGNAVSRVGYYQLWETGFFTGANAVVIYSLDGSTKVHSGINTKIGAHVFPLKNLNIRTGASIGNVKNCWELGAFIGVYGVGNKVSAGLQVDALTLIDNNTLFPYVTGGLTVSYKIK